MVTDTELQALVAELSAMASEGLKKTPGHKAYPRPEVSPEHYINGNRRGLDAPAGYEAARRRADLVRLIGADESFRREAVAFCVVIVEQRCECCGAVNEYVGSELIETWAPGRRLRAWVKPSEVPPSEKRDLPLTTKRVTASVCYCGACAEELSLIGTGIPWIQGDLFVANEAARAAEEATAKVEKTLNRLLKGITT